MLTWIRKQGIIRSVFNVSSDYEIIQKCTWGDLATRPNAIIFHSLREEFRLKPTFNTEYRSGQEVTITRVLGHLLWHSRLWKDNRTRSSICLLVPWMNYPGARTVLVWGVDWNAERSRRYVTEGKLARLSVSNLWTTLHHTTTVHHYSL